MAYTTPAARLIRPWQHKGRRRYGVYRSSMLIGGADGRGGTFSTGTGSQTLNVKPGRIVGVQYGLVAAPETWTAATSGVLVTKAESTAGVQIFTDADINSGIIDGFAPVGTTAVDEARGVTAATDGFSGGFPIRGGIFNSIASGTDGERVTVDYLVRHCTYARVDLTSTSGADGAGAGSFTLDLGGPGVLAALAIDFQNMPATSDIIIAADDITTGEALFTGTSSATDLAPSLLGRPGADEAIGASAATDGTEAANGFKRRLVITLAEADAFTGDEKVVVEMWIDD